LVLGRSVSVGRSALSIKEATMSEPAEADRPQLTSYETDQVAAIAAWKSEPPNPISELWQRMTLAGANVVEKLIPDRLVSVAIETSYDMAAKLAGPEDIKRQAGVRDLADLRDRPLEECDRLAKQVGKNALVLATVEGAATGAGGVLTTLIDVPLLFALSLRTILRIGHCYGYALDDRKSRYYVLGVMTAALSGSLDSRRHRIHRLRELEHLLIEELQEETLAQEVTSFLFQLEIFEEVPGVGAISGGLLNLAFLRRVDMTARRVFQERWLRDNGKLEAIAPARAHARHLATGWSGALGRTVYSGCYYLGFGVAIPVCIAAELIRPMDNALTRGIRDGTAAAKQEVERLLARDWVAVAPPIGDGEAVRALARA
jgi:EcsC protein family